MPKCQDALSFSELPTVARIFVVRLFVGVAYNCLELTESQHFPLSDKVAENCADVLKFEDCPLSDSSWKMSKVVWSFLNVTNYHFLNVGNFLVKVA